MPESTSILMFPSLLCQLFSVCVRNPPPAFGADIMHNVTAVKGDDVEFRCRVMERGRHMVRLDSSHQQHNNESLQVAFIRAEDPPRLITFDDRIFRQRDKYEILPRKGHDEWILKVKNVRESDIGGYICQINSQPVLTKTAYLDLKIPPTVSRSSTPSAVEVREGHNVTLTCHANGNPPPNVVWRRADRQIIRFNGATGYGASVVNGTKLHLTKVSRKHMSEYVCVASNGIPPDESWTVKLHVIFEPMVIPQATIIEARRGSLVRLVCNVEAWPRALVTWYHNDVELYDTNKYSTEQAVVEKYKSVHILEIKVLLQDQFGVYKCIADNGDGKHFAEIRLIETPWREGSNSVSVLTEGSGGSNSDTELDVDDPMESNLIDEVSTRRRSNLHGGTSSIATSYKTNNAHTTWHNSPPPLSPELRQVSASASSISLGFGSSITIIKNAFLFLCASKILLSLFFVQIFSF